MPKKKRKNKGTVLPPADIEKKRAETEGKYLSRLEPAVLTALQKRKMIFMLLSTLFFAVSLFLPVAGREKVASITWLSTLYLLFDIALIIVSVYVSYQSFKKHRIRSEIFGLDAPKGGFDRHTFWGFELFNALHAVMFASEVVIGCLTVEVWGILNWVAAATSFVLSLLARQVLYHANAHNLEFLPPRDQNGDDAKSEPQDGAAQGDLPDEVEEFYDASKQGTGDAPTETPDTDGGGVDLPEDAEDFYSVPTDPAEN